MKLHLVIVGNGIAATRTVEELLSANADQYHITILGKEPFTAYNRILLSPLLAQETTLDHIQLHDSDWYRQQDITLHTGPDFEVVEIDRANRKVVCVNGQSFDYHRLLLATGSKPVILNIPGNELNGVIGFRGVSDVWKMQQLATEGGQAVVIGGGLLGLEAAHGLNQLGMSVTVVHRSAYLLNRQLDVEAAQLLQHTLEQRGISFRLASASQCIHGQGEQVTGLELDSGEIIPAKIIVMAIGISPDSLLAQSSGLACNRGVLVDDCMQTFDPSIYSVGECVEHRSVTFGLVEPILEQAKVCANHLAAHGVASYRYQPSATRLKVAGIQLFSSGELKDSGEGIESIIYRDPDSQCYKKLLLKNDHLVGAILYGDTVDGPWYQQLITQNRSVASQRHSLMFGPLQAECIV